MTVDNKLDANSITRKNLFLNYLAKNWAFIFLLFLLFIFSFTGENFLSLTNFQNIIHLSTIFFLLAAAETFVIITSGIDLSVGFIMGFSSVLSAKIIQLLYSNNILNSSLSIFTGCLAAIIICLIPGFISGFLIAKFRVPPFIATLGVLGVVNGITLKICQGFPVGGLPDKMVKIGNGYFIYLLPGKSIHFFKLPANVDTAIIREYIRILPYSLVFIVLVLLVLIHILKNTRFGRHTFAIGGNKEAAVRSGIKVKKHLILIYMLSAFLAALAGVFDVFQTGIGNFTPFSAMYELFAIAGVIIGGASLMGGKGRIIGSVIGVLLLGVIENGLSLSGVEPFYRFIAVGLILILAVIIDQLFPDLL